MHIGIPTTSQHTLLADQRTDMHGSATGALALQPELTLSMRKTLVAWLVQIHHSLALRPETLFVAVEIMDRASTVATRSSSCHQRDWRPALYIRKSQYQLLGLVSLWIAAKLQESTHVPSLQRLARFSCNVYKRMDFVRLELLVLATLSFQISSQTAVEHLHLFADQEHMLHGSDAWQQQNIQTAVWILTCALPFGRFQILI